MSRKYSLLAAAFAFTAILGAGSVAHAQAQSDMIPPGAPLPGGSTTRSSTDSLGAAPPGRSAIGGSASSRAMATPPRPMARSGTRAAGRPAMRRSASTAAANPNGAYMGGGGVYERQADGSLRPVM